MGEKSYLGYCMADVMATASLCEKQNPNLIRKPKIKKVIFNAPATIIIWEDGVKTVVKCQEGDTYNPETGFALAYLKRLLGNDNTFNKEIAKWVPEPTSSAKTTTPTITFYYKNVHYGCCEAIARAINVLESIPEDGKSMTKAHMYERTTKALNYLMEVLD